MTTAQDIVTQALKANGIGALGQTPNSADLADGFAWLQRLLAQWQRKRWLVWHLVDTALASSGLLSYSVGVGGYYNIPRPDQIEGAYARLMTNGTYTGAPTPTQPGILNIDYPLYLIQSYEEYARISIKGLQTFPGAVFYDAAFPLGNVFFWPVPDRQFELHILTKETLQQFVSLTDTVLMPPEYEEAMIWSLAARLRPSYGLQPDPTITAAMSVALQTLRIANLQIPELLLPSGLPNGSSRSGAGWWWAGNYAGAGGSLFNLDQSGLDGQDSLG